MRGERVTAQARREKGARGRHACVLVTRVAVDARK